MAHLVGIAGASGSGKTSLVNGIQKHLDLWGVTSHVLSTDDCYRDLSHYSPEERDGFCFDPDHNFDHPWSVDFDRLVAFARNLREGRPFNYRKYEFKTHSYGERTEDIPADVEVGIIEGIFALYSGHEVGDDPKELVRMYDRKIFVVTTPEIGIVRRVRRDIDERGRPPMHALRQIETTVIPMLYTFILPTRQNADDVVNWRTDERRSPDEIKQTLIGLARQRAMAIYESVRGSDGTWPLPQLDSVDFKINLGDENGLGVD